MRRALVSPFLWLLIVFGSLNAQWNALNPVAAVRQESDGALFTLQTGTLRVQICGDALVRVLYSPTSVFPNAPDYVVTKTSWPAVKWTMQSTDKEIILATSRLKVTVTRNDGAILYSDLAGNRLVQESSRTLTPVKVNGEDTYRAESFFNVYGSTRRSTDWDSTRPASGTIAASRSTSPRTTPTSPSR